MLELLTKLGLEAVMEAEAIAYKTWVGSGVGGGG